jgi:iron complex transport system permease protein
MSRSDPTIEAFAQTHLEPEPLTGVPLRRRRVVVMVLAAAVVAVAAISVAVGAVSVSWSEIIAILSRRAGVALGAEPSTQADAVLWGIRLPRVLLGLAVGTALAVAGTALQGIFRNPLADPQLLAIGPGAALGAVIAMLLLEAAPLPAVAGGSVGALAAAAILERIADRSGADPSRLILIGVALGAVLTAVVGLAVLAADRAGIPSVDFWILGSLGSATWRALAIAAPVIAVGVGLVASSARALDLMALGESEARHLGVDVDAVRRRTMAGTSLVVGAAVGVAGVIGFVGLLIPHVMRRWVGPGHAWLIAASALGGATFLAAADLLARTVASPTEIPVGLVTTVVGGPFFLWLLARSGRRGAS